MAKIDEIIFLAREFEATDIYITAGMPLLFRVNEKLVRAPIQPSEKEVEETIYEILNQKSQKKRKIFEDGEDINLSFKTADGNRQRMHVFRQRKRLAATIHLLSTQIPDLEEISIFPELQKILEQEEGLILVAGKSGSGRTTRAVSMLEYLNKTSSRHILTLENPVEYLFQGKKSLIHQREIGRDIESMEKALKSAVRESCDVVFVAEIEDYKSLCGILKLVEAGNLVIAVVDVADARRVQKCLLNLCPEEYRSMTDNQLEYYIKGIIQQKVVENPTEGTRQIQSELITTIED